MKKPGITLDFIKEEHRGTRPLPFEPFSVRLVVPELKAIQEQYGKLDERSSHFLSFLVACPNYHGNTYWHGPESEISQTLGAKTSSLYLTLGFQDMYFPLKFGGDILGAGYSDDKFLEGLTGCTFDQHGRLGFPTLLSLSVERRDNLNEYEKYRLFLEAVSLAHHVVPSFFTECENLGSKHPNAEYAPLYHAIGDLISDTASQIGEIIKAAQGKEITSADQKIEPEFSKQIFVVDRQGRRNAREVIKAFGQNLQSGTAPSGAIEASQRVGTLVNGLEKKAPEYP